jgi:hypothetical protein
MKFSSVYVLVVRLGGCKVSCRWAVCVRDLCVGAGTIAFRVLEMEDSHVLEKRNTSYWRRGESMFGNPAWPALRLVRTGYSARRTVQAPPRADLDRPGHGGQRAVLVRQISMLVVLISRYQDVDTSFICLNMLNLM